ncbi:MAG: hypothetical protein PVJ27_01790 [Candidatus Brocadiaceae bacterium]
MPTAKEIAKMCSRIHYVEPEELDLRSFVIFRRRPDKDQSSKSKESPPKEKKEDERE